MARKLLDQLRDAIRARHYSYRTEESYVYWVRRFILFHGKKHPNDVGKRHVEAFLTHLAVDRNVADSTQNLALSAILFLYREVLKIELPWLDEVVRAKKPARMPVVLERDEVRMIMARLPAPQDLVISPAGSSCFLRRRHPYGAATTGHSDVRTTMIYTHVINRGAMGARSPLDGGCGSGPQCV